MSSWRVGAAEEARTCGRVPDLAATVERLLKPLVEQVRDHGSAVRQLVHAFGELTRRLDTRLQGERTHADQRFRQHEDFLRRQVDNWLRQSGELLSAVQESQGKARGTVQDAAVVGQLDSQAESGAALAGALAPVRGALGRIELHGVAAAGALAQVEARLARLEPDGTALAVAPFEAALARIETRLEALEARGVRPPEASARALAAALGPTETILARIQAQLAAQEAGAAKPPEASAALAAALEPMEAALWRIEAKLAPLEAGLAGEDYARTSPPGQGGPGGAGVEALTGVLAQVQAALARLAPWEASPVRPPGPAGSGGAAAPAARTPAAADGGPLAQDASAAAGGPALQEEQLGCQSTEEKSKSLSFFVKPGKSSSVKVLEDRSDVTFFGMEYEEVLYYRNNALTPVEKKFYGLALRWLDWLRSLEEPKRTGCLVRVVQSRWFELASASVIVANAIFMVVAVDNRMEGALTRRRITLGTPWSMYVNRAFVAFYSVEIALKLAVHRVYYFTNSDLRWNIFDIVLVLLALLDIVADTMAREKAITFNPALLRSLRVLKMAKLLRVLRIMRVFKDLRMMLATVVGSFQSLFWSFAGLAFVYYLYGLLVVQSLASFVHDAGERLDPGLREELLENFGSVLRAMLTLYKATTGGDDWSVYFSILEQTGPFLSAGFIFFVGFVHISLMNILTAVFVEKAMAIEPPDTVSQAKEQREKDQADAAQLRGMLRRMDTNKSGSLSAEEFRTHLSSLDMRCCFKVLGLEIGDAQEFFEMLAFASQEREIDIEAFVQGCMQIRGNATGVTQQKIIIEASILHEAQKEYFQQVCQKLDALTAHMRPPARP